jgi:hypothetical protein
MKGDENERNALVTLGTVFVVGASSLEQRLVDTATTCNDTDSRTGTARHGLFGTTWQTNASFVVIWRVTDDGSVVARGTSECATVTNFFFDVADDGTFWALADGKDIADCQSGLFPAVDEGTGVETFSCDEGFFSEFIAVWVAEYHSGKWGTTGSTVRHIPLE